MFPEIGNFQTSNSNYFVFPSERLITLSQLVESQQSTDLYITPTAYTASTRPGVGRWPLAAQNNGRIQRGHITSSAWYGGWLRWLLYLLYDEVMQQTDWYGYSYDEKTRNVVPLLFFHLNYGEYSSCR